MTDHELIAAWLAGDERAATAIVERHSEMLRRMAYKLGVREEVEELVQDVFVRAFRSIHTFRADGAALGSWLVAIERRLVLDRGRAERRNRRLVSLDDEPEPASEYGVLDEMVARETEAKMSAAVKRQADRTLLRKRLAGQSWRDIAQSLDADATTLRVRFHRIRAALRAASA